VNALVTGLIVFRIFKVFQEVKTGTTDDQLLGVIGGTTLQRIIFILIESGMTLFSIQLARLVVSLISTYAANNVYYLIIGTHEMLIGITPTIILVRVSMGLSFHDENSMAEASIGVLDFRSNNPKSSIPDENEIVDERKHDDFEAQLSEDSDIQMVDRSISAEKKDSGRTFRVHCFDDE